MAAKHRHNHKPKLYNCSRFTGAAIYGCEWYTIHTHPTGLPRGLRGEPGDHFALLSVLQLHGGCHCRSGGQQRHACPEQPESPKGRCCGTEEESWRQREPKFDWGGVKPETQTNFGSDSGISCRNSKKLSKRSNICFFSIKSGTQLDGTFGRFWTKSDSKTKQSRIF